MRQLMDRIAQSVGVRVEDGPSSWTIRLGKRPDLVFEIVVPHEVLEWYVSARNAAGQELWSSWMDYAGYTPRPLEDRDGLAVEMQRDVEWFVSTLVAADDVRFTTERLMVVGLRTSAEWFLDARWQPLSLVDPARIPKTAS